MSWDVETLRATAFGEFSAEQGRAWWPLLNTGEEPDSETSKPKQGEYIATAAAHGGNLTLQVQPGRVDIVLRAAQDLQQEFKLPSLGKFSDLTESFAELVHSWFTTKPRVSRIAFGSVLFHAVESREDGYRKLGELLPSLTVDSENSEDLFYQINRPRISLAGVDNLAINRLSKWSVLRLSQGAIRFESDAAVLNKAAQDLFSVRLELDINSSAKFQKHLPVNRLKPTFDELITLGIEISAEGDIA